MLVGKVSAAALAGACLVTLPAVAGEAGEGALRLFGEFRALVAKGDLPAVRALVDRAARARKPVLKASDLRSLSAAAQSLEERRIRIRWAAAALVGGDPPAGGEVELATKKGVLKGTVESVADEGLRLSRKMKVRGRVLGEARFTVKWSDLAPEEEDRLARGWEPEGTGGALARALLADLRGNEAQVARALEGEGDHPFARFLLGRQGPEKGPDANAGQDEASRGREEAVPDAPRRGTGLVGLRTGRGRRRAALRGGGSAASEAAVDNALEWLQRHQEKDGRWEGERKYEAGDCGSNTDVGTTGLALLAFLGAGHTETHAEPLKYRETVKKAVAFLIANQRADGAIGHGYEAGLGYHHAIAGLALAEAYGMARIPETGRAAQKAVDYSVGVHQAPHSGWRYSPKQAADLSVTGWFVAQLKSALVAGLKVDGKGFQGAASFLDKVTEEGGAFEGVCSYMPGRATTPTMTAIGMLCRQLMGWRRSDPLLQGGADYLVKNLPEGRAGEENFYYWYYGTLAMFQMGGDWWKAWNAALRDMLIERQRRGPPRIDGSWNPVGAWCGSGGGRVYSTAMACLCLEVYYRCGRLYGD